jgi:hypothetical protein
MNLERQKNSKIKVEKAFCFIFKSSCAGKNEFLWSSQNGFIMQTYLSDKMHPKNFWPKTFLHKKLRDPKIWGFLGAITFP